MEFRYHLFVILLSSASRLSIASPNSRQSRSPAYDYIYRDDPNYSWELTGQLDQDGFTSYFINMTSQKWMTAELHNRPIWWHYLIVHVPNDVLYPRTAALYISGRNNLNSGPDISREHVRRMGTFAVEEKMVTAVLEMIPNQPIQFEAAVRAMDTIASLRPGVDRFMLSGQSKRGWTTWIAGAVDERVIAMAPTVLSCLNMQENFQHYWRSFGGWPFALRDFYDQDIMTYIDQPEMRELERITDAFAYRKWITVPKMVINGASDDFFLLDDFDYFFNDLPGEKYIWILENHGHGISNGPLADAYWANLAAFTKCVIRNEPRPEFYWWKNITETGGSIRVYSPVEPLQISGWSAPSVVPNRRDIRTRQIGLNGNIVQTGITWTEYPVEDLGNGNYLLEFDNPPDGYRAFFIKVTYAAPNGKTLVFTTNSNIIPGGFPYEDCRGADCQGTLV